MSTARAMVCSRSLIRSRIVSAQDSASVTATALMSEMFWPSMVTPSTSGLSRRPLHTGQGRSTMYFSSSVLMYSESVSR